MSTSYASVNLLSLRTCSRFKVRSLSSSEGLRDLIVARVAMSHLRSEVDTRVVPKEAMGASSGGRLCNREKSESVPCCTRATFSRVVSEIEPRRSRISLPVLPPVLIADRAKAIVSLERTSLVSMGEEAAASPRRGAAEILLGSSSIEFIMVKEWHTLVAAVGRSPKRVGLAN